MTSIAFLAYPSDVHIVVDTIRAAVILSKAQPGSFALETWEEMDIPGQFITNEILRRIEECSVLIADISRLNFNVSYEIGYGIGKGKRILLIKHKAVKAQSPAVREVGIFDTLG